MKEDTTQDKIDRETKRVVGTLRKTTKETDRANAALKLSLLAMASTQKDKSKADRLLDLIKELEK